MIISLCIQQVALSPDGKYIAVGDQDSRHHVLDESFREVGSIEQISDYPHFALFSADGKKVAFNSCQLFWVGTIICSLSDLIAGSEKKVEIEPGMRVFAGVSREDHLIRSSECRLAILFPIPGKERSSGIDSWAERSREWILARTERN